MDPGEALAHTADQPAMNALSKSKPEGATRKRLKLTPTAPAPGELHVSETVDGFDSSAGRVLIRTRRYNFFAHVGGRGPVPTCRYEVAIRTARSVADGRGFVVICRGLGDRTAGQSHLDAYLQACNWIERTIAAEGIRRTAPDREPVPSSRQAAPDMPDGGEAVELAPEPRPRRPRRAMPPARDAREGLRRLLNVRTTLAERLTGEDPTELRHKAVADATGGRTRSSMDRSLSADEMGHAVSYVEDYLHSLGHQAEMDAQDAEYAARRGRQAA